MVMRSRTTALGRAVGRLAGVGPVARVRLAAGGSCRTRRGIVAETWKSKSKSKSKMTRRALPSVEKQRRHQAHRQWVGRREVDVLATVEAAARRAAVGRGGEPGMGAAAEPGRHGRADGWFGAQPAHRRKLRRTVVAVEQIFDVEGKVEATMAVSDVQIDLREPGRDQRAVSGRRPVTDTVEAQPGTPDARPELVARRQAARPGLLGRQSQPAAVLH